MKYPLIKKAKIKHKDIAKAFGYKNVNSFRCSSAHKRIMQGVENILTLYNEEHIVTFTDTHVWVRETPVKNWDNTTRH